MSPEFVVAFFVGAAAWLAGEVVLRAGSRVRQQSKEKTK